MLSPSRIASRFMAQDTSRMLTVNLFDDDPPGVPVYLEGRLRNLLWLPDARCVVDFLAGIAVGAGYEIVADGWSQHSDIPRPWQGASHPPAFRIKNPDQEVWERTAECERSHHEFIQTLLALYKGKSYGNIPFNVISES